MMKMEADIKTLILEIQEQLTHLEGLKQELDTIAKERSLPMRRPKDPYCMISTTGVSVSSGISRRP